MKYIILNLKIKLKFTNDIPEVAPVGTFCLENWNNFMIQAPPIPIIYEKRSKRGILAKDKAERERERERGGEGRGEEGTKSHYRSCYV